MLKKPSTAGSVTIKELFKDIGLSEESAREEPATDRPPSRKKRKGSKGRSITSFPVLGHFTP